MSFVFIGRLVTKGITGAALKIGGREVLNAFGPQLGVFFLEAVVEPAFPIDFSAILEGLKKRGQGRAVQGGIAKNAGAIPAPPPPNGLAMPPVWLRDP